MCLYHVVSIRNGSPPNWDYWKRVVVVVDRLEKKLQSFAVMTEKL